MALLYPLERLGASRFNGPTAADQAANKPCKSIGEKTLALTPSLSSPTGEGESFDVSCQDGRAGLPSRLCPEWQRDAEGESGVCTSRHDRAWFPLPGERVRVRASLLKRSLTLLLNGRPAPMARAALVLHETPVGSPSPIGWGAVRVSLISFF